MNRDEAKQFFPQFFRRLECAFPVIRKDLEFNSPDIGMTHKCWGTVLADCTPEECDWALQQWLDGSGPDKADYDKPAHGIRSMVYRRRNRQKSERELAQTQPARKRMQHGSFTDGLAKRLPGDMTEALSDMRRARKAMQTGDMSQQDYNTRRREILNQLDCAETASGVTANV